VFFFIGKALELIGQRFGRLEVLRKTERKSTVGTRYWYCRCDCGNFIEVRGSELTYGMVKSCGCKKRDHLIKMNTKHGLGSYNNGERSKRWFGMIDRCYNIDNPQYINYGARGIKVCERWKGSLENFYSDMGDPPFPTYTIDRIDNDGNYLPENCRWATKQEQVNNRRNTRFVTFEGKTKSVSTWARDLNICYGTLLGRLRKWGIEKALTSPVEHKYNSHRNKQV
jgi:hypothetical protein